jgi:hypothetical protein
MNVERTNLISLWLALSVLSPGCAVERERPPINPDAGPTDLPPGAKTPDYDGDVPPGSVVANAGSSAVANAGGSGNDGSVTLITGPTSLAQALTQINQRIDDESLPMTHVTPDDVGRWFEDGKYFQWLKAERTTLAQALSDDKLESDWTLRLAQEVELPDEPWRLTLCAPIQSTPVEGGVSAGIQTCATIAEGSALLLYTEQFRAVCDDPTHVVCDESFAGAAPPLSSVALSAAVQVRIEPISVSGEPRVPELAERDALDVSVELTPASIPALVDYFGVGYDRAALENRLNDLLGTESSKWVQIQAFFFGWVRDRANTFPGVDDNDVCHGPARQFYDDTLYNGDSDRSTEATALLLHDHYCLVNDDVAPRFGDYLYDPGVHSARYVLNDPTTGRDIVFSVQSGGIGAYRFWWADEDMSNMPFAHAPMADYRERLIDVWRRCR